VPIAATATSRAAIAGSNAMLMSLLKPIGATTVWIPSAIWPAIDTSDCFSPGPACGKLASAHKIMVVARMIVPARFRKIAARCHRPMRTSDRRGIWYLGSSIMKWPPPPFTTVRRSTSDASSAPTIPAM
jgi:hypothetical protein